MGAATIIKLSSYKPDLSDKPHLGKLFRIYCRYAHYMTEAFRFQQNLQICNIGSDFPVENPLLMAAIARVIYFI